MKGRPFLKYDKTRLFDKCKKEKKLNSPDLSNMTRGTLIVEDCDKAIYPCSNYRPSNLPL